MKAIITIIIVILGITITRSQSLLGNKPADWIEDSLMCVSDYMTKDTTIYAKITEYNKEYTYSITKFGDSYTFQQVDKIKLFTNYKAISGLTHFFGGWAAMVGHDYIKKDKVLHLIAGDVIASGSYVIFKALKVKHPMLHSIATGIIIGGLKEYVYDGEMNKGTKSFKDFAWTGVGAINGALRTHALYFKIPIR